MHGVFLCEVLLMWVALGVPEASNIKNTLVEKSQILHNIFIYLDLNYTRRRREGKFILLIRQRGDKLRTTLRKIRKRTFHYYLWRFSLKHTRRQNVRVFFVFFWIFKVITSYAIYTIKFSRHYQKKMIENSYYLHSNYFKPNIYLLIIQFQFENLESSN